MVSERHDAIDRHASTKPATLTGTSVVQMLAVALSTGYVLLIDRFNGKVAHRVQTNELAEVALPMHLQLELFRYVEIREDSLG